ncbi:hypothetical protein HK102_004146 [Quaeritorhiza haematococci]|nr:hypothetical protein HK102_004146 [Quaeritorhiza haematococci]
MGENLVLGGLSMTRALGDLKYKMFGGVIAEPDIRRMRVSGRDVAFMVLVSDGVTEVLSNQEIVDVVKSAPNPSTASNLIIETSTTLGATDNKTCLVIRLPAWSQSLPDLTLDLRKRKLSSQTRGPGVRDGLPGVDEERAITMERVQKEAVEDLYGFWGEQGEGGESAEGVKTPVKDLGLTRGQIVEGLKDLGITLHMHSLGSKSESTHSVSDVNDTSAEAECRPGTVSASREQATSSKGDVPEAQAKCTDDVVERVFVVLNKPATGRVDREALRKAFGLLGVHVGRC